MLKGPLKTRLIENVGVCGKTNMNTDPQALMAESYAYDMTLHNVSVSV